MTTCLSKPPRSGPLVGDQKPPGSGRKIISITLREICGFSQGGRMSEVLVYCELVITKCYWLCPTGNIPIVAMATSIQEIQICCVFNFVIKW
jgi:hypothetical protein